MGQLMCASLSHTHYWYEVGMLKVPAIVQRSDIRGSMATATTCTLINYSSVPSCFPILYFFELPLAVF